MRFAATARLSRLLPVGLIRFCLGVTPVFCGPPELTGIHPIGAWVQSTNRVEITGSWESWPPEVWTDTMEIRFSPEDKAPGFTVVVGDNVQPGAHLVRLHDRNGASSARLFVVGTQAELKETEPNNHFRDAQDISQLPITINGKLEKRGDVDQFKVSLKQGQNFKARLDAYTLMGQFDGVLRLLADGKEQVTWNHDGITLDPELTWTVDKDGDYALQVFGFRYPANSDVSLTGGDGCEYRLHLELSDVSTPMSSGSSQYTQAASLYNLDVPSEIGGRILNVGEVDYYRIFLGKGKSISASVLARACYSPLDAWVEVENLEGKSLKRVDDSNRTTDPVLEWTATEDGNYLLAIGNSLHQGGPDFHYRLILEERTPTVDVELPQDRMTLAPGETKELKCKFSRLYGYQGKATLRCDSLPEGVSMDPVELPEKDGEITLGFKVESDPPPFNGPIQLHLLDMDNRIVNSACFPLVTTETNNGVPGGYARLLLENIYHLWIFIPEKTAVEEPEKKE